MVEDRIRALTHPFWIGALVVLVVNDAYLKGAHPGAVTGKLSDLAGVVVVAWLLGALTRRPAATAVLVSAGFVALKLVPGVAELLAPVLGGISLRDATDLLGLVALVPSVVLLRKSLGDSATPERRADLVRVAVAVSAATTAALAVGATSCAPKPGIGEVRGHDGTVWVDGVPGAPSVPSSDSPATDSPASPSATEQHTREWARSTDGGRTWSWAPLPPDVQESTDQVCDPRLGCFRIARDRTAVEHREPGSREWQVSKAFTRAESQQIDDAGNGCAGEGVFLEDVVLLDADGGPEVVVGAGTQGVLHRTADGAWHRRGVFEVQPVPFAGPGTMVAGSVAWLLLPVMVVGLAVAAWVRTRSARRVLAVLGAGIAAWILMAVVTAIVAAVVDPGRLAGSLVALGVTLALSALLALIALRRPEGSPPTPPS